MDITCWSLWFLASISCKSLALAFRGELRSMADQGLIAYPYSIREEVNMVKHYYEVREIVGIRWVWQ